MAKPAVIPLGCWPARMTAEMAAGYVGETSAEAFLSRVGTEYPAPVIDEGYGKGRRRLWMRWHIDEMIGNFDPGEQIPEPF